MEQSPREQHGPALRVTVLAGGTSPERNVSLESGQCVMHALRERGHFVTLLDPAVQPLQSADFTECDVVFPLVHGTGGEDGELQRQLQQLCVPFRCGADTVPSHPHPEELEQISVSPRGLTTGSNVMTCVTGSGCVARHGRCR